MGSTKSEFSLAAYNEARRRLRELSSVSRSGEGSPPHDERGSSVDHSVRHRRREKDAGHIPAAAAYTRAPHECGDGRSSRARTNRARQGANSSAPAAAVPSSSSHGQKEDASPPLQTSAAWDTPEEDLEKKYGAEHAELSEALVKAVKTAGLRPARENALIALAGKLERQTKEWVDALEDRVDKWRSLSRALRKKYEEKMRLLEEEVRATEIAAEEERRTLGERARSAVRELEARRETEGRMLREQIEEERKRMVVERERAWEDLQKRALREVEEKMIKDLERTKVRLRRESKAQVDKTMATLEEEFKRSCASAEGKAKAAEDAQRGAESRSTALEHQRTQLENELKEAKEALEERARAVVDVQKRLATQQRTNRATEDKIRELEESFQEVVNDLKRQQAVAAEKHATEVKRLREEREMELQELDARIRKSMAAKDQMLARARAEAAEAQKEAAATRILLEDIYKGFRPSPRG